MDKLEGDVGVCKLLGDLSLLPTAALPTPRPNRMVEAGKGSACKEGEKFASLSSPTEPKVALLPIFLCNRQQGPSPGTPGSPRPAGDVAFGIAAEGGPRGRLAPWPSDGSLRGTFAHGPGHSPASIVPARMGQEQSRSHGDQGASPPLPRGPPCLHRSLTRAAYLE